MKKLISTITAILVLAGGASFAQAPQKAIGTLAIETVNVSAGYTKAIKYILANDLQKRGVKQIEIDKVCMAGDKKCFDKLFQKNNIDEIIELKVVGYGKEMSMEMILHANHNIEKPDSKTIDFKEDELEIAFPRLIESILKSVPVSGTLTSQNMTEEESESEKYIKSRGYFHLALGGNFALPGFHYGHNMFAFEYGYGARWQRIVLEGRQGFSFSPNGSAINFAPIELAGKYHFTDKNIAPFAGMYTGLIYETQKIGSVNFGGIDISKRESKWGMELGISGGITFLRHLKMHVPLEVRYQHTFMNGQDANEILLLIGINF